jgi:hypothetical protein
MKVETRGKYPGVKIHLDAEECEKLMQASKDFGGHTIKLHQQLGIQELVIPVSLACKMGKKIEELQQENPNLLKERTPEEIAAILAKEAEKAGMQLNQLKNGKDWKKVDSTKLEAAMLKHTQKVG